MGGGGSSISPLTNHSHSLDYGTFFVHFEPPADNPPFMDTHGKKTFSKSLGGGAVAPLATPLPSARESFKRVHD